jgi:Holliday junction resolvase
MKARESKLQTKISTWLRRRGWLVVKISLCSLPGWPDLCAIKRKKTVWLEIKDNRELDPLQQYRHAQIKEHGGLTFKIGTWEEFIATGLQNW